MSGRRPAASEQESCSRHGVKILHLSRLQEDPNIFRQPGLTALFNTQDSIKWNNAWDATNKSANQQKSHTGDISYTLIAFDNLI
jgi:hypothetical protein